jgi:hypothetical protein
MVSEPIVIGSRALLLDSNTVVPPSDAGALSVTVQVVVIPAVTLLGLQVSCETEWGCPSAMLENENIATAATARLLDGFEFRIVLTGPWLPETQVEDTAGARFVWRILGHDDTAPAKRHELNLKEQFHFGAAVPGS